MTAHLTDAQLRDFAGGVLKAEDLLRADDHLSTCGQCRARAESLVDAGRRFDELSASLNADSMHLTDEELQMMARRASPSSVGADAMAIHLRSCATCAAHVEDLRSWVEPTPRIRLAHLAIAATVALAVLIPAGVMQWRAGRPSPSASNRDPRGLDTLAAADRARVNTALAAGSAALPGFMNDMGSSRDVLMGAPAGRTDAFDVIAPRATGTVSDRPPFEWRPLEGSPEYVVSVFDEQSNLVVRSPAIVEARWVPAEPLARDRTYVWQVTARRGSEAITVPAAPAPPAKFHVIDAAAALLLQRLEAEQPDAHVLLGILSMESGIVDAATRHLRQVGPTDPGADVARRSLERLLALREPVR